MRLDFIERDLGLEVNAIEKFFIEALRKGFVIASFRHGFLAFLLPDLFFLQY